FLLLVGSVMLIGALIVLGNNSKSSRKSSQTDISEWIESILLFLTRFHHEIPFLRLLFQSQSLSKKQQKKLDEMHGTYRKTFENYQKGMSIKQIANKRGLKESTIRTHIRELKSEGVI
ncbi:MAG: helix-turn-helix domain-containing protein, partial [bacterium]